MLRGKERRAKELLLGYKPSVMGHGNILRVHLIPKFGVRPAAEITTMEIQSWVTELREREYAPHSIDHFHEVMNAVMRTAATWYNLEKNLARGVQIGKIKPLRKKWALSVAQANALLERLELKQRDGGARYHDRVASWRVGGGALGRSQRS